MSPLCRWLRLLSRWKRNRFPVRSNKSLRYHKAKAWGMVKEHNWSFRPYLLLLWDRPLDLYWELPPWPSYQRFKDLRWPRSIKFGFVYSVDISTVRLYCNTPSPNFLTSICLAFVKQIGIYLVSCQLAYFTTRLTQYWSYTGKAMIGLPNVLLHWQTISIREGFSVLSVSKSSW